MMNNNRNVGESNLGSLMVGNLEQIRLCPETIKEEVRQFYRHTWIMMAALATTVGGLLASYLGT